MPDAASCRSTAPRPPTTRGGRAFAPGSRATSPRRGARRRAERACGRSARCARAGVRGLVPGLRRVGAGGADLAGRVRRARRRPGGRPGDRRRAARRTTSAGSTRSASTWPRRRCSPTAPRSSGSASCPPIVRNEEGWCQLFSEPGAGVRPRVAGHARRARRRRVGASRARRCGRRGPTSPTSACLLARTDPDVPSARASPTSSSTCTQPGVEVRPLRHIDGEVDFNEVFLERGARPRRPAGRRGRRRLAGGQRHAVGRASDGRGLGSGGVDRIGGSGIERTRRARRRAPVGRVIRSCASGSSQVYTEERIRGLDEPAGARRSEGGPVARGREQSIGKVHQGALNQRIQLLATDLLGHGAPRAGGTAGRRRTTRRCPTRCTGMLRSRANTIEGGTTEVNKNILGERVLGLPREPDPWHGAAVEGGARAHEVDDVSYETPARRAARARRVAGLRPARRRQRHGRRDAGRARAGVARARRRPRRAGDRQHRRRATRSRPASTSPARTRQGGAARAVPADQRCRAAAHRLAQRRAGSR